MIKNLKCISTTKMMIQLLEIGYIKMLDSKEKGI